MEKERAVGMQPDQAAIRMRAFDLWRDAGMPEGHDLEFWFQAEKQLGEHIKATGSISQTTVDGKRRQSRIAGRREGLRG